jgi:hypothetical protein
MSLPHPPETEDEPSEGYEETLDSRPTPQRGRPETEAQGSDVRAHTRDQELTPKRRVPRPVAFRSRHQTEDL